MVAKILFLGTGGGRFVTIDQIRATGGIYVRDRGNRIHMDPGPGALIAMHRYRIPPSKTNILMVSHCHPDHYIDTEILIEAMTNGCRAKRGFLLASESIVDGVPGHGPAISKYHKGRVGKCRVAVSGDRIDVNGTCIEVIPAYHSDPSAVGFKLSTESGIIVWGSDTALKEELYPTYSGARVLIISVTTPVGLKIPFHLNTEDAAAIAIKCRPRLCIITHFGVRMIKSNVSVQARWIEKESGIKTIAARDGMRLSLDDNIRIT